MFSTIIRSCSCCAVLNYQASTATVFLACWVYNLKTHPKKGITLKRWGLLGTVLRRESEATTWFITFRKYCCSFCLLSSTNFASYNNKCFASLTYTKTQFIQNKLRYVHNTAVYILQRSTQNIAQPAEFSMYTWRRMSDVSITQTKPNVY